jgi:hypothetical protein
MTSEVTGTPLKEPVYCPCLGSFDFMAERSETRPQIVWITIHNVQGILEEVYCRVLGFVINSLLYSVTN